MGFIEIIVLISAVTGIVTFIWWLYERWLPYQKISWRKAEKSAEEVADKMNAHGFSPTIIMGIGRGGAIFGSMLSGALGHRALVVIDRKYKWTEEGRLDDMLFSVKIPKEYTERVLLVAGEAHSGGTMRRYYDFLRHMGVKEIRRAVLYLEEGCPVPIEYYGIKSSRKNKILPWMFAKQYMKEDRDPYGTVPDQKTRFKIKVHFARHAECSAGEDIFVGNTDSDLTVKGIEQAISLGQLLQGRKIGTVYSSPLGRAVKTAKIVNSFLDSDFIIDERLREIDYGSWDGRERSVVRNEHASLYENWLKNPSSVVPEHGEKPTAVINRLQSFLSDVANHYRNHDDVEILVVSHKTAIRIIVADIEEHDISHYRDRQIKNTEILTIAYDSSKWQVSSEKFSA
jgi:broad specificity phosphatase PhoE/hypoxanthine phosphoribosyltransferase